MRSIASDAICLLIDDSFLTGQFPDKLKLAKTMPLYKKGSTLNMNNYRPISLLSIFSKIYENIMYARFYQFLEKSHLVFSLQFGFRAKHSTNHALISITETIKESIDNNKFGCGVFLDLRKAFDTVNHKILLAKLQHYGVREMAFNWFQSYLTNRRQYVEVNGTSSDVLDVMCGVPQGSVLGPLLFLIFVNDLPAVCKRLKFYLFDDDTNIYFESDSLDLLEETMNKELRKIDKWLTTNRLALNVDKLHFVLFHSSSNITHRKIRIKIRNERITEENDVKLLGVLLDSTLSWKPHITELSKKLSKTICIFCKLRHYATADVLKLLYYALLYPFLIYGSSVWGMAYQSHLDKLQAIQNKFIKAISFSDKYDSLYPLFHTHSILKISSDIIKLQIAFVFESWMRLSPLEFHTYFTSI